MELNSCTLGEHIEFLENTNNQLQFGINDVRGVNNLKRLIPTKADLNGRDLSKFQIVNPGDFVFNHRTSRNGSKFSIAYNDGDKPVICTEDYVVFRIKEESKTQLLAIWLYMFFNRSEFDRYVITNSWGSSTEFYNWEDICSVKLVLPPISVQQKYVDIYKAVLANQRSYERGVADLKVVIEGCVERARRELKKSREHEYLLGELIEQRKEKYDGSIIPIKGVSRDGFIDPKQQDADLTLPEKLMKCSLKRECDTSTASFS